MTYQEIMASVESGTIIVDNYGHSTNPLMERLMERYHRAIDYSKGAGDGTWASCTNNVDWTTEEWNIKMRDHFQRQLDAEYEIGEDMFDMPEIYCFHCANTMQWVFDGDRISLRKYWDGDKHVITKGRCILEFPTPMVTKITTGGHLVFTNFFRCDDSPEGKKYIPEYDLNSINGRRNIAEYKAKTHNIAYGQMSNMSVGVFINNSGDSIIIGNPYIGDYILEAMTEEEYEKNKDRYEEFSIIDGHKLVGTICLDVWRWEAGDRDSLGPLLKELESRGYTDIVRIECQPGEWEVTHYFDIQRYEDSEDPIYSRLVLKK